MNEFIGWFNQVLTISIQLYFQQECEYSSLEEVKPPVNGWLEKVTGVPDLTFDERMVVMLALMPHVCPQILDIFFVQNKNFDRQYTEFGGWKGLSHGGFLPTGETASFILAGEDTEKRKGVIRFFQKDHWFYTKNILRLEGAGEGEPFLSGQLRVSEEFLSRVLLDKEYKPDYNIGFPAKRITTQLEWEDMVLDYQVATELEEINVWISSGKTVMEDWGLSRILKAGYRSLFYGPPGLGKTTLSAIIANEMGTHMKVTSGPAIEKPGEMAAILNNLQEGDVLFVDEIHRLNRQVEEVLYPAMEDFAIDIMIGKGASARSIRLDLPKFTLVGATTRAGLLSAPLRDRFGVTQRLEFYDKKELTTIILRSAQVLGVEIEPNGAAEIAKRSRGTPRLANRLLKRVRDFAQVKYNGVITYDVACFALDLLEVDQYGLDKTDRRILQTLILNFQGGPVGLETLAASIGEDSGTLEDVYEPYLLQTGFLNRTPRGRMASVLAYTHLGYPRPDLSTK